MSVKIRDKGDYEIFETNHDHRILVLNDKRWFAWIHGDEGEILVHSDSDHKKDKTLEKGKFFMADFEDDPKFQDNPHLFLEDGEEYREVILPNGFPTEGDYQKKVVSTDEKVGKKELERYLDENSE